MANKVPVRGETSLQSTKRLLDELDVLMEKMLALPVTPEDGSEEMPRLPKVSATLTVLESSAASPAPFLDGETVDEASRDRTNAGPTVESPRLDAASPIQEPHKDFEAPTIPFQAAATTPAPASESIPEGVIPPALLDVKVPKISVLPVAGRALGTVLLQPLLLINGVFDLCLNFAGPLGKWLKTGRGRNTLGVAGVLLMLLAVGWLIRDWMSWTR